MIKAQNEKGEAVTMQLGGTSAAAAWISRIFQHEYDHLQVGGWVWAVCGEKCGAGCEAGCGEGCGLGCKPEGCVVVFSCTCMTTCRWWRGRVWVDVWCGAGLELGCRRWRGASACSAPASSLRFGPYSKD